MDGDKDLSPAEEARDSRRDRDAEGRARAGMRTGLAKLFKQILDAQRKRAVDDEAATAGEPDQLERHHGQPRSKRRKA